MTIDFFETINDKLQLINYRPNVINTFHEGYSKLFVFTMAKLLNTFWAFLLHVLGISVFQTCFAHSMKDSDGNSLLSGPPLTSSLFASAIYIIILKSNLFPDTFRKPQVALLALYEVNIEISFIEIE